MLWRLFSLVISLACGAYACVLATQDFAEGNLGRVAMGVVLVVLNVAVVGLNVHLLRGSR